MEQGDVKHFMPQEDNYKILPAPKSACLPALLNSEDWNMTFVDETPCWRFARKAWKQQRSILDGICSQICICES